MLPLLRNFVNSKRAESCAVPTKERDFGAKTPRTGVLHALIAALAVIWNLLGH
jgi:hypothetical protein